MTLQELKSELTLDPNGIGYATHISNGETARIAEKINQVSIEIKVIKDRWMNDRGMASELVPLHGVAFVDSIFTKFDAASEASPTVKRMVNRLYNDAQGLNFGDAGLRGMFASWRGNLLSENEADALLSLGTESSSRAEALFGANFIVSELQVIKSLEL